MINFIDQNKRYDTTRNFNRSFNERKIKTPFVPPREVFDLLYEWEFILRKKLDKMKLLFRRSDSAYDAMV